MERQQQTTAVFYQLYDGKLTRQLVAQGKVKLAATSDVADLQEAVYTANDKNPVLQQCNATNLQVYPPNTTEFTASNRADAEDTVNDVLASAKPAPPGLTGKQALRSSHRIILVVRPPTPPSTPARVDATSAVAALSAGRSAPEFLATILGGAPTGSVLDFGTDLEVGSSQTRKVFIRQCYTDFFDLLVEMYRPGVSPSKKVVVAGTPGIGKYSSVLEL
jgi:hypothetical protein